MNLISINTGPMMSSKEIAALTGKLHKHVLRDIRAMVGALIGLHDGSEDVRSLVWTMDKKSIGQFLDHEVFQELTIEWDYRGYAAEILLNRRLSHILVSGYSVPHRARIVDRWLELEGQTQRQVSDPRLAAMIESLFRLDELEVAQRQQEQRVQALENQMARIETATEYFTVLGWATLEGIRMPLSEAATLGRRATTYCKQHGIQTGEVPDPRFGKVNTYPVSVLEELYDREAA